jgi:heme-degrading monooxygenase HmoA
MHVQVVTYGLRGITEDEYLEACQEETATFAGIAGLLAKLWLRDRDTKTYGAVYLWRDRQAYDNYVKGDIWASVQGDETLSGVTCRDFEVLEDLTAATQPGAKLL